MVKHTLDNVLQMKEVVINIVNYDIVQQMSLSSCEYPQGVDEFIKAGLTPIASDLVKPFRVKEAPVQLECKVLQIIPTGEEGGAGNLVICEVVCMHVNDDVLNEQGMIDIHKIDLVARMGGDYYARVNAENMFIVPKPNAHLGIGFDNLPKNIVDADWLTRNDKARLANVAASAFTIGIPIISCQAYSDIERKNIIYAIHNNQIMDAWAVILK
jgi:flavin reductase (DIM6/NTAB) family NADH-FMN oxidoreductase RutF